MSNQDEVPDQKPFVKGPRLSEMEMQKRVEQIRTDVSKKLTKWADKIQVSMAFTPKVTRMEGEQWFENGKKYTLRNGIKESVSILQEARMPWWCPKCKVPMNHRYDRKFYYLRGMCFNCNIDFEGQMRLDGTWPAFEKRMLRENEKAFIRDSIDQHLDYIRTFKLPQAHYEDGRWEELATLAQFEGKFSELERDVEFLQNRLEVILKEEQEESDAEHSTQQPA